MDITSSPSSMKLHQQQQQQQSLSSSPNSSTTILLPYWSQFVHDASLLVTSADLIEDTLLTKLCGGSDNGQFVYFDSDSSRFHQHPFTYHSNSASRIEPGEIVLEIEGQKVSGYTLFDVLSLIKQVCQMQSTLTFKAVRSNTQPQQQQQTGGYVLPLDLRQYLDERFQKGSMDYELQQIIRENVYMRTVPCTTRQPRTGEINGQDYIFLSNEDFLEMENNGELLEYGVYNGHYYGTPKPPKQPFVNHNFTQQLRENGQQPTPLRGDGSFPLKQNGELNEKSQENNVNGMNNVGLNMTSNNNNNTNTISSTTSNEASSSSSSAPSSSNHHHHHHPTDNNGYHNELVAENGQANNNNNTQSNNGSLMSKNNSISNSDGIDIMPYGWEKVEDPEYGVYYVDHINQSTTYDHPNSKSNRMRTFKPGATMSRNSTLESTSDSLQTQQQQQSTPPLLPPPLPPIHTQPTDSPPSTMQPSATRNIFFTQNPEELKGEFIKTSLLKTPHGFGFTIIGANETNDDFLQIKYIVPEGAAARDGQLRQGDVLVFVNNECVLGFTHQNVVEIFQSIPVGQMVDLTVCRGYPLSIDPNDPNIEIMPLAAINNLHQNHHRHSNHYVNGAPIASVDELAASINNSLSLSNFNKELNGGDSTNAYDEYYCEEYEELFVSIVKGPKGFGFTIADDAQMNQQKVKQIIDRERCVNLRENDVLLEINGYELKNLGHNQVVELLKECVRGQETSIKLKRRKYQITLPEPPSNSSLNAANNSADGSNTTNTNNNNHMKTLDANEFNNNNNQDAHHHHHHYQLNSNNNNSGVNEEEILINNNNNGDLRSTTTTTTNSINSNSAAVASSKMPSVKQANFAYHHHQNNNNHYNTNQMAFNIERRSKTPNILHQSSSIPTNSRSSANLTSLNNHHNNPYQPQLRSKTPTTDRQLFQHSQPNNNNNTDYIYLNGNQPSSNNIYTTSNRANVDIEHHIPIYDTAAAPPPTNSKPSSKMIQSNYLPPINPNMMNRSKTPGPEMIYFRQNGGPTPVANEFNGVNGGYMRSKTPTAEMYYPSKADISPKQQLVNEMYQMPPYDIDDLLALVLNNDQVSLITDVDGNYYLEMVIDLVRQETGFGFRIVGGEEEGSQVSVGYIVHSGSAHIDGRLRTNDEIIMIDSECVLGATHRRVVQLMTIAGLNRRVKLMIRRKLNYQQYKMLLSAQQQQLKSRYMSHMNGGGGSSITSGVSPVISNGNSATTTTSGYPYTVTLFRNNNEGFGFVIISTLHKNGPSIGKIVENSPAERCKRLNVGDRILAVNGTNITQMNHIDVVKLIKESGNSITLTIGPPSSIDDVDGKSVLPADYLLSNSIHNINNQMTTTLNRQTSSHYISPVAAASSSSATKAIINQNEYHVIELRKHQSTGFGFSIRGGKEFNIPLYVLKLAEGGPASMDGRLQVGDQILEINSSDAYSMTHHEAIERIRAGGNVVTLLVRRTGMPPPSITDIIAVNSSVQHHHHHHHQQQQQQHPVSSSMSATNISNNDVVLRAKSPYMNGGAVPNNGKQHFNSSSTLVNRNY